MSLGRQRRAGHRREAALFALLGFLLTLSGVAPAEVSASDEDVAYASPALAGQSSAAATTRPTRSLRLAAPRGARAGDVLLAGLSVRVPGPNQIFAPPGWALVRGDRTARGRALTHAVYMKVASPSEPAAYRWEWRSRAMAAGGVLAYAGVDVSQPVDGHSGHHGTVRARARGSRAGSLVISAPSLATSTPGALVLAFFATAGGAATQAPDGTVERYDVAARGAASSAAADFVQSEPGPTGPRIAAASRLRALRGPRGCSARRLRPRRRRACSASRRGAIGQMVALRPARRHLAPAISSVDPAGAAIGKGVTIAGSRFSGAYSVTLSGVPASFSVKSRKRIDATVPAGAGSGRWRVVTLGGAAESGHFVVAPDILPDLTPPDTTIDSGPAGSVASSAATFTFSSSEPGSTFECRLDGSAWAGCTSPTSHSGLASGTHTFEVRARDAAGNTDPLPASRAWTVASPPPDTTPPVTTITAGPSGTTSSTSASFSFSSNETASTFDCRLDGGPWASCSSPRSYSGLADGSHTFEVRAKDAAANVDPTPASRNWTIDTTPPPDTTPPETTVTAGPSGTSSSTSADFSFISSEAGSSFACRLDAGAWGPCSSPRGYSGLAEGSHSFEVRATDAAGNVDLTPASRTWTIDTTPPPGGSSLPAPLAESTGAVFHVAKSGSDSNPGSAAAPWLTVQKALNTLTAGQRALVHAGTYTQALDLTRACTAAAPCTVEAAPGEARPVLRITNDHVLRVESSGAYWRVRGFTFRDSDITSGGLVDVYGHHLEFSANELTNSGDQDFYLDEASHHVQILANWIHHSGRGRTHQSHGAYLQGNDHLVANNVIHDHPYGFGIQVYDKGLRSIVVNNTITHNAHSGIVVGGSGGVSGVVIRNNVFAHNSSYGISWDSTCPNGSAGTTYADHNVIYGNGSGAIDPQSCSATNTSGGNRTGEPLFVDTAGRNLHLRAGSPAFGYALPEWASGTDHDGEARPQGGAADAGAYEEG